VAGTTRAQQQAGVLQREQDIGRKFDGLGVQYDGSASWGGVYGMNDPNLISPRLEQWAHDNGSFPVVSWTPNYTIAQINNGAADAIWAKAANYFKTYPFPIMLRPFWEFDGPWFTWGYGYNGANYYSAAEFKNAWQRMVNIFRANGATNVGFFWTPQEGPVFTGSSGSTRDLLAQYYPGDAYVDWVGTDAYNLCVNENNCNATPLHSGWASFNDMFNYSSRCSCVSSHDAYGPHKPIVVGETGSYYDFNNTSNKKGDWFRNIPAAAKNMPYLRGIAFYDVDASGVGASHDNFLVDYPTSDPSVYAGFKALAADPWFNTN
jgi:hypothetical protein